MKKYLCILLSSVLIFMNISYSVYADVPETYQKTKEYLWQIVKDIGFIGTLPFKGIVELVNEIIHSKGISGEQDVTTEQEALDYVFDGISINGNGNIVLNDNAKLNINTLIDNYINDNKYYVGYSLNMEYYPVPQYFKDFIETRQGANYIFCRDVYNGTANGLRYEIYVVPKDKFDISFVYFNGNYNVNGQYNQLSAGIYNNLTFQGVSLQNNPDVDVYNVVSNVTSSAYGQINDGALTTRAIHCVSFLDNRYDYRYDDFPFGSRQNQNNAILISCKRYDSYPIFGTYELFTSSQRGKLPYYFNNNVYTDFSSSVGDYTLTTDNSNHVTYGDITTYIDDHHTETGDYPTLPEINIWIESQPGPTPLPTPTPSPGGGSLGGATATANNEGINININNNHNINVGIPSLSGNTVSGNGSGSSGGIFDWISDIGGVIGDFIKNVGQLIADVIKGITETITTVLADIPNIISTLVEFVYGGLPDELKAIVTLGITTVIFVGVIKMMRK